METVAPAGARLGQQARQPRLQCMLQEVAGDVYVARAGEQRAVDLLCAQAIDGAQMRQDGAVAGSR